MRSKACACLIPDLAVGKLSKCDSLFGLHVTAISQKKNLFNSYFINERSFGKQTHTLAREICVANNRTYHN